jgi:hypothetical protein
MTSVDRNIWRKSSFSASTNCVEVSWRRSSFSTDASNCVEIGWRKSSASTSTNCVELAIQAEQVAVRDTKNTSGPVLTVPTATWQRLLANVTP